MPPFRNPHWPAFLSANIQLGNPAGRSPADWADQMQLRGVPNLGQLSKGRLNRASVRGICRNPNEPVLFAYVCAMAWGGQKKKDAVKAWHDPTKLLPLLKALRSGGLTRQTAYQMFDKAIPGLGPSYFTKLLHFFSPIADFYIVDNIVLRAMALLTGHPFHSHATVGGYLACCEEIDAMSALTGWSGEEVEERLFAGGKSKPEWRRHVLASQSDLPRKIGRPEYREAMHASYPHISPHLF